MLEIILDASSIELLEPCPRKYYYSQVLNIIPRKRRTAFDIGSYYHEVLDHYYSSNLTDTNKLRSSFEFAAQVELFAKYGICDIDDQKFHRKRLAEYLNYWEAEDSQLQIISTEKGFSYLLYEDSSRRYILEGKIDLIGKGRPYGLFVMDHKTQQRKDDRWEFNHQVCNYLNYMRKQGLQPDYFVYNYIGLQDKLPPDGFRRQIYQPPDGMLEQWEKEVKLTFDYLYNIIVVKYHDPDPTLPVNKLIGEAHYSINRFNRRRSACDSSKYGLCQYHKLCSIPDGSKWANSVLSHYKEKPEWKPW